MECSICLQLPQNVKIVSCCLNHFCNDCLQNWIEVKNSCPLCNKLIGSEKPHNSLKEISSNDQQQFDNGLLYFQNELATINTKIGYFNQRLNQWQRQSKNFKSHISSSHLQFVNDQLQLANQYLTMMTIAVQSSNRQNATLYSQLLTQLLNAVDNAFEGKSFSKYEKQYYDYEQDDYNEEQEEYIPCYTIRESGNKNKQRKGKKQFGNGNNIGGNNSNGGFNSSNKKKLEKVMNA